MKRILSILMAVVTVVTTVGPCNIITTYAVETVDSSANLVTSVPTQKPITNPTSNAMPTPEPEVTVTSAEPTIAALALEEEEIEDAAESPVDERECNLTQIEETLQNTGLTAEDLGENYPEFSKYVPHLEKIEKDMEDKDYKVGKEVMSCKDVGLEAISQKLSYVCHKIAKEKNIKPYPVQVLAAMKLVESVLTPEEITKGSVGNIKTGEGKSLIITLTAIILQSYDRKIDIVTPNMELATRDWKEAKQYYDLFDASSGFLYDKDKDEAFIEDSTPKFSDEDDEYNLEVMDKDVVYSTGANFQWMYLKSVFAGESIRKRKYDVCIVDEADNLLIDGATSPALIANNFPTLEALGVLACVYQKALKGTSKVDIKSILQENFKDSTFTDEEIKLMIDAVKKAQEAEKGKDYVVEEGKFGRKKVRIIDNNTGFKLETSRWHAYVHEMVEIKEHIRPQQTMVTNASVPPMIYFGAYKNLLGVTGTTGGEKESEYFKNVYKLSTFEIPTHRRIQRDVIIKVYDPETENLYKMLEAEAKNVSEKGRPVLVIMDSINAVDEMKDKYLGEANLIKGVDPKADRESIKDAGRSGKITISTIAAGRGTDVKLDEESLNAGGLHVIVAKLPSQSRTLIQNIGRSARQGQPGSATVYVRPGDDFKDNLPISLSAVNLFKLQEEFSNYIREKWPWMFAKKEKYTSESEYRFGADYDEILRTDAKVIVDKFFWPKKVLNAEETQELLDLTKNMVLNAWGSMYTHLATSENGSDMDYCENKYTELKKALDKWFPSDCKSHEDCIRRWAKELGKDKEIFDFLYTRYEGLTIRDFLKELFNDKRLCLHARHAGHDTESFESMLRFMPEEHQRAYEALVNAEASYRELVAKYNRDVVAYNQREAERERIAKENDQVYTKVVSKTLEIPAELEVRHSVEGPQQAKISDKPQAEENKNVFQRVAECVINALPSITAGAEWTEEDGDARSYDAITGAAHVANSQDFSGCKHPEHAREGCVCRICAAAKDSRPAMISVKYDEVETFRATYKPLPDSLPYPICPNEPNWTEIGWTYLMGHSVKDTIWDRWGRTVPDGYYNLRVGCCNGANLGEIDYTELNRLDENIRKISYQMEREEKAKEQREQSVRVALRGASGGMKILGGIGIAVGSVAAIAAVIGTEGAALLLVVAVMGTAGTMFGISDTIEGANDIVAATTKQGLDQQSYNPLRDTVFGGNELVYAISEMGASLTTSALASKALASTAQRLPMPREATAVTTKITAEKAFTAVGSKKFYSPVNPHPELSKLVQNSFSGGTFTEEVLTKDTTFYRVYGGEAGIYGRYLTRTPQGAGLQSQLDLALNPSWGNTTENITKVVVPKGTVVYEGSAAPQNIYDSLGNIIGELPGGGNQIYIPEIKVEWFK